MGETRTEKCGTNLISAQTEINRAVFELNRREMSKPPGRGPAPDDDYTLRCVISALAELAEAADFLLGQKGVRR
jgi:hypothetical protein